MDKITTLAFFTPVLLFFQQTRGFLSSILRFFWKSQIIPSNISIPFYKKLNDECIRVELANWTIGMQWAFLKKEDKEGYFLYKRYPYEIYIYKYIFPILITSGEVGETFNLHYFNFTFPLERWINDTYKIPIETWKSSNFWICLKQGRSSKLRNSDDSGHASQTLGSAPSPIGQRTTGEILSPWYLTPNRLSKPFYYSHDDLLSRGGRSHKDKFIFTRQTLDIKQILEKWLKAKDFYESKNIPYKYSVLMSGLPGCGKSSGIREICRDVDIPIYVFDISTMDNQEFATYLSDLPTSPAAILFEDIETQFVGRENTNKTLNSPGLTFDFFINALSGVNNYTKNKIIFATTNHIEKLDPALLRRFDKKIEIYSLSLDEKRQYLSKLTDNQSLIKALLEDGKDDTNAVFEQKALNAILSEFWKE